MLELKNVNSGYAGNNVLKNVSLEFEKGCFTAILGENGSGKTTMMNTVAGIIKNTSGEIIIDGIDVSSLNKREHARLVSYLMQGVNTPEMTVGELVLHGRFPYLDFPYIYSRRDRGIADDCMKTMDVFHLKDRMMTTLSGGMKQRVYLAMALCQNSEYILLDEPTTYLDVSKSGALMELLVNISKSGKGIVAVIHDIALALTYADDIVLMKDGMVIKKGKCEDVFLSRAIDRVFGVSVGRRTCENGFIYYIAHNKNKSW